MNKQQNLAVFGGGWWEQAVRKAGSKFVSFDGPAARGANPYDADVAARLRFGREIEPRAASGGIWVDNGGTGLNFVSGPGGENDLHLLHERCGATLVSHFVDPVHVCLQRLPWPAAWMSLGSRSWIKAVWDRAHATELERFGVPGVIHVPMAAPDGDYDETPLKEDDVACAVSFVGGQNTRYFSSNMPVGTGQLFAGALAGAVRADLPGVTFYDVYHDLYGLSGAVPADEPVKDRFERIQRYYAAKLFHHASLCLRNRDRYVIFLRRQLGNLFHLAGRGWNEAYGIACDPPLSDEQYRTHFRRSAINLNFVNGNAETGLNMRHFEITAAGGFLLCHDHPELEDCFVVGEECDVFRGESELLEKIEYYLGHAQRRIEIARAGQKRTLSEHLYSHRLRRLLDAAAQMPPTQTSPGEVLATASRPVQAAGAER